MVPRYHCDDEMDYIGKNDQGHCFECKHCGEREFTNNPEAPTTPEETARYSFLEWNRGSRMGKTIYNATK